MLADAIVNAKELFNIPDCLTNDLDEYVKLTDDYVINKIL